MNKVCVNIAAVALAAGALAQMGHISKNAKHVITCPVTGEKVDQDEATKAHLYADYKGNRYFFCCGMCPAQFKKDPSKFAAKAHIKVPDSRHAQGVDDRGDKAMGFSHEKTQHHFRLFADGGSIDIETKSRTDADQREAIREHLKMIAAMFGRGDFHLPTFIHDTVVPGQKTMEQLKKQISYAFSELPHGARVKLSSRNPKAVAAIHQFMRFQIEDHRTGDSGQVEMPSPSNGKRG